MTAPWDKYAQGQEDGPWAKYGQPSFMDKVKGGAANLAKGVVSGVADLGDTALNVGASKAANLVPGFGLIKQLVDAVAPGAIEGANKDRSDSLEDFNRDNADSTAFTVGRVGGNIAATLPVGGVLGGAAKAVGATKLGTSMASGGFRTGAPAATTLAEKAADLGIRAAGGAATGGASAGLVDPASAGTGAIVGGALPAAGKVLGDVVGKAFERAGAAGSAPAVTQKLEVARAGAEHGLVVPPIDLQPGLMTRLVSGLSGKIKTSQTASERNQPVFDHLARKALGVDGATELTPDVLQGLRKQAGAAYETVRGAGPVTADPEFLKSLDRIAAVSKGASRSFPGLKENGVDDLIAAVRQPTFDAGDAIDATMLLRDSADKAFRQGDTTLGRAAKVAATALEDQLERHLTAAGNPEAVKAFQAARQQIAKTYTVQKSLNPATGSVSAPRLAKDLEKGRPLTGELEQIARFSQAFPKASQSLKEAPGTVSPLDWLFAGGAGLGAGSSPIGAAALLARPLARQALLSKPAQARAMRETAPNQAIDQMMELALPLTGRVAPVLASNRG